MLFDANDTLLFIGDSITDYNRGRPVGEGLHGALGTSYVADVNAWLNCVWPEYRIHVINMGINGNQVRDLEKRWETDVEALHPDWVSVLIGINDVWRCFDCPDMPRLHVSPEEYEAGYVRLIERTLPNVKGMILMTPYFMEPNRRDPMRAMMDEFGAIVKKLAARYGLVCVDLQSAWDELFTHMHPCNIAWDRIHPSPVGHMLIMRQFLKATGALDRADK